MKRCDLLKLCLLPEPVVVIVIPISSLLDRTLPRMGKQGHALSMDYYGSSTLLRNEVDNVHRSTVRFMCVFWERFRGSIVVINPCPRNSSPEKKNHRIRKIITDADSLSEFRRGGADLKEILTLLWDRILSKRSSVHGQT